MVCEQIFFKKQLQFFRYVATLVSIKLVSEHNVSWFLQTKDALRKKKFIFLNLKNPKKWFIKFDFTRSALISIYHKINSI